MEKEKNGVISFEAAESLTSPDVDQNQAADDDQGSSVLNKEAGLEETMSLYSSFIVNMLNNLGPLPLGRIHNTLKMFVTDVCARPPARRGAPHSLTTFLPLAAPLTAGQVRQDGGAAPRAAHAHGRGREGGGHVRPLQSPRPPGTRRVTASPVRPSSLPTIARYRTGMKSQACR